jgi:hypothetical protein
MLISEKLKVLGDVGIVAWFESDDESARIIVNGIASYYFEEMSFESFCPSDNTFGDWIYTHFKESGYDIDWFELVSLKFANQIREDASYPVSSIGHNFTEWSDKELESNIISWVDGWCWNCRKAFLAQLAGE